jgi:hypothetical protein
MIQCFCAHIPVNVQAVLHGDVSVHHVMQQEAQNATKTDTRVMCYPLLHAPVDVKAMASRHTAWFWFSHAIIYIRNRVHPQFMQRKAQNNQNRLPRMHLLTSRPCCMVMSASTTSCSSMWLSQSGVGGSSRDSKPLSPLGFIANLGSLTMAII